MFLVTWIMYSMLYTLKLSLVIHLPSENEKVNLINSGILKAYNILGNV